MLAPICLFTYNRPSETKHTVKALQLNYLAKNSDLYIFSDGPKTNSDALKISELRNYLKNINGFKSVKIFSSETNEGLAKSIIDGVSQVIKKHGKVIVLEDDLITSPNFLNFMNQALDYYSLQKSVFSISGYGHKLKLPNDYQYDVFLRGRPYSWGWATWLDRWETVDWEIKDWDLFKNSREQIEQFNLHGKDLYPTLKRYKEGKINTWAIRFAYNQFKQQKLTVCPCLSKVRNNGFGNDATHCKTTYNRHRIRFDLTGQKTFHFTDNISLDPKIVSQLSAYHDFASRAKGKLLSHLIKNKIIKNIDNVEYIQKLENDEK